MVLEKDSLIKKEMIRIGNGIGYDSVVTIYMTMIIIFQLSIYMIVDLFVIDYTKAGLTLLGLIGLASFNFIFFKLEWYIIAKINLILAALLQVSLTTFILFRVQAGFYLYYFIVIAMAFALLDYSIQRERMIILAVIILVTVLLVLNNFLVVDISRKILSSETERAFFYTASIVSLTGVASLFWVFAADSYQQRIALDRLANTDGLTGVMNRRRFFELADKSYRETKKKKGVSILLIFDIDHFKVINDTYGHPVGDTVLKELADLVQSNVRQSDLFARYGGEEFAIMLNDTNQKNGLIIAEEIRLIINDHIFCKGKKNEITLTVSIGMAGFKENLDGFEGIVKAADKALYIAKEQGRNRVVTG